MPFGPSIKTFRLVDSCWEAGNQLTPTLHAVDENGYASRVYTGDYGARFLRSEDQMTRRRWAFVLILLVVVVALPFWWWFRCGPATTFLIVRHADREGASDALNPLGVARAQELVHVGQKAGMVAIYHSDTNRARDTAAPLATALGITPVVYPPADTAALVDDIFADHRGETVLVVGHSNTVPQVIEAAGGPSIPNIDDQEFDNLFVLTVCRCRRGPATLVNLQYGAQSP